MKFIILLISILLYNTTSFSKELKENVEFTSDKLEVDENLNLMTATGNVIIKNKKETIKADIVKYYKDQDKAIATGNVVITNIDGTKYEISKVILTNEFKDILALTLYAEFKDNSKIKASKMIKNESKSIFIDGKYTPCDCEFKNGEKPIWQLNSSKVTHDVTKKTIYFKNVVIKILDFPFFYFPYISHPDPTVQRQTGFLTPSIGYSSRNGIQSSVPYYFVTENQSWDTTFTNHLKGKNGYVNQLNTRKKYLSSSIETNLYQGVVETHKENEDKVFAANLKFNTQLDSLWKIDGVGKYTDQDTFMKRYNFDNSSNYKSYIKAEKVTKNSISEIEWYEYNNLEVDSNDNQPNLQPSIKQQIFQNYDNYSFLVNINAHEIKNDESYNIQRWNTSSSIEHQIDTNFTDIILSGETGLDLYAIKERPSSDTNDNKYLDRFSLGLSILSKKDFFFNLNNHDLLMTPKIQFVSLFSTDRSDDIPNRDSSDYRIDQANLFLINQYQGRDNIQTNHRFNYGVENNIYSELGSFSFFFGQSQKIGGTQDNTIVSTPNRQSDFITELKWNRSNIFNLSYNTLLDHHNLESNYTSLEFFGEYSSIYYKVIHRSVNKNLINDNTDREEIQFSLGKKIDNWKISYSNKYDLNNNDSELVEEEFSIDYVGDYMFQDCLSIKLSYKNKDGSPDRDILPENSVFLTISLKNLGEYGFDSLF